MVTGNSRRGFSPSVASVGLRQGFLSLVFVFIEVFVFRVSVNVGGFDVTPIRHCVVAVGRVHRLKAFPTLALDGSVNV